MTDNYFTKYLDDLSIFQKLLANGLQYNTAYLLAFGKVYEDERNVIGVIDEDGWAEIAPKDFWDGSQVKK